MKKESLESVNLEKGIDFYFYTWHLLKKDKIQFYYVLKSKDGKLGIVKHTKIEQLSRAVLLTLGELCTTVESFLNFWKCNLTKKEMVYNE